MLASIGVLLVFGGVSTFLIGLVRHFFPAFDTLMPESFKQWMSMRYGVYIFLAGVLLLRFF